MWISRVELVNFKSYQHQVFEFPAPNKSKNIILIGGMNGYGKTSILEALYLGLFGKDAVPHLSRAGLKNTGYRSFLENALHGNALKNNRDMMSVAVQINTGDYEGFIITRKWYFNKFGHYVEEEALIYTVEMGVHKKPIPNERANEILEQHFIPAHLAPFFFFDGEEVKSLASQNRIEQIKMGMEGLLGVVILRELKKRLQQFQIHKRQGVANIDEEKHRNLFDELTMKEAELEKIIDKKLSCEKEIKFLQIQQKDFTNRILSLGGGGGDIASLRDIIMQQRDTQQELDECQEKLDQILSEKLPFHLISPDLLSVFREQLSREINKLKWDTECSSLKPKKDILLNSFWGVKEPIMTPALSSEQKKQITERLENAWERLFYPPPVDCAETIMHSYLSESGHAKVFELINATMVGADEIRNLIREKGRLSLLLKDLISKQARIEGIDRDGTLTNLTATMAGISAQLEQKQKELGGIEREVTALDQMVKDLRATYEREHEKFIFANPVNSLIGKAERVQKLIQALIPRLYALKTKHLAEAMSRVFKNLAHKTHINSIEINEDGSSRLLSASGSEIKFDKSAGEDQLFATSLIAALAQVSGIKAPLVVDTPLGRLDSRHRSNILDFWVSDTNRQVILLSQDKEIDNALYKKIKKHVLKTYMLSHQELSNGVGKTIATENSYFEN